MDLESHKLIPLSQSFVVDRNKPSSESKDATEECGSLHTRANRIPLKKNVKDNTRLRTIFDGYVVIILIIIVS